MLEQGFGVLAVHDLGHTLRTKGLPCRISVYTEAGQTRLGMIRPEVMLAGLSADPSLKELARAVEASTRAIIEAAAA